MKYLTSKTISTVIVAILVSIQFVRTSRNEGIALTENDIAHAVNVPADVQKIIENSCYDCHSNHTNYPWYANVQPVGLWLQWHVNEGKHELNFSEFNTYKLKRKKHKLEEIAEQINEHDMPLWSYTLIHTETKLSPEQTTVLANWAKQEAEKIIVPAE